jgi:hypothetical protein
MIARLACNSLLLNTDCPERVAGLVPERTRVELSHPGRKSGVVCPIFSIWPVALAKPSRS